MAGSLPPQGAKQSEGRVKTRPRSSATTCLLTTVLFTFPLNGIPAFSPKKVFLLEILEGFAPVLVELSISSLPVFLHSRNHNKVMFIV